MAPSYANLFMAELEERMLTGYHARPTLWKRYIDDILVIWPGNQESLDDFVRYLNNCHNTIKFTCESSTTSVDFLDLTLYKGNRFHREGKLDIKPGSMTLKWCVSLHTPLTCFSPSISPIRPVQKEVLLSHCSPLQRKIFWLIRMILLGY